MDFMIDTRFIEYLKIITSSSDVEDIREAWENLIVLEQRYDHTDLLNIVRTIINNGIDNIDETPRLLEYFSHTINENPFEVIDTTQTTYGYKNFLKYILVRSRNLNLLCLVIKTLTNCRSIYLPNYESIAEFCKAIVCCLSLRAMPENPDEISDFKEETSAIYNYLLKTIGYCENKSEKQSIVGVCRDTVYELITVGDPNSIPGAALAVIMRLVEPAVIPEVVHSIIAKTAEDEQLSRLVTVLCKWLMQWLKNDTLVEWIEKFIEGLYNERRFAVFNSVTNNCLKSMLRLLVIPMATSHWMPIIRLMLVHMGTPKLFHKVTADIERLLKNLAKIRPSQSASECAQDLVNYVYLLMARFPDDHSYESLKKCLPFPPQWEKVQELLNSSKWVQDNKLITNNYYNASENNKRIGLNNLGNTCYLNSVLQALVMTSEFREQILVYDENSIGKNRILHELQRLFALLLYSQRSCLSPTDFLRASRPAYFTQGQQHDSAEFLCHLLDVLYEEERKTMVQCNISDVTENDKSPDNTSKFRLQQRTVSTEDDNFNYCHTDSSIQSHGESNVSSTPQSSLVHRVFGGESNTTYQCNQCHTSSHNNDHYWELQLSFPEEICSNREVTVKDLINYYLTPEKLTGDNMYHCDRCNSLCDAQRIIKILRAPAHLILTLKHFHYDIDSRLKAKLFHNVTYNETIQIPVLNNGHSDAETYQLYAAVVHSGYSMDYGHYFTYARDRTKKWYKFNDSCVLETSLDEFFQLRAPCTPYILFYEKITNDLDNEMRERPVLETLGKNIRNTVAMDIAKYQSELKNCVRNRITQLPNDEYYQLSTSLTRRRDNSDDDNPPPANCRDSVDIQPNRFLY